MITKMVDLNRELILDELSNFERRKSGEIPVILEKYLESIAQNGDTMFSWNKLRPLLRRKLESVMNEFNQLCPTDHLIPLPNVRPFDFEDLKQQILQAIDNFCSAPFTIQRICELITNPSKHYKRTDKFMRGIEKNILVVTTVEPRSTDGSTVQHSTSSFSRNIFSSVHSSPSTSLLVNGMTDIISDQQMALQSDTDPSLQPLSSQMSSINSSSHLAPLQQLDSFTTVFATTPSTPLSVVSDLQHSYEHSSSIQSMMASTSIIGSTSISSEHKIAETSVASETCVNPDADSPVVSSSSCVLTSTSTEANSNSEVREDLRPNTSSQDSSDSKSSVESNQTNSGSEVDYSSEVDDSDDKSNEVVDVVSDGKPTDKETKSGEPEGNANVSSSESVTHIKDNIADETSNEVIDSNVQSVKDKPKPIAEELMNGSQNSEITDSEHNVHRMAADEEMSQPMEFCRTTVANDISADMTDCSDKPSEKMDDQLSQSDQSEPMEED